MVLDVELTRLEQCRPALGYLAGPFLTSGSKVAKVGF